MIMLFERLWWSSCVASKTHFQVTQISVLFANNIITKEYYCEKKISFWTDKLKELIIIIIRLIIILN